MAGTESVDRCALLMDAQILSSKEECASSMGQRDCAKAKVAQIKSSKEECAEGTVQRSKDAAVMDAKIEL